MDDLRALGVPERFSVAHRAGNELARLREAEAAGADIVEADIWLYRGRLEVRHLKTAGPLPILWDRWRIANPWAPRLLLPELLAAVAPDTLLMLDVKGWGDTAARVAATMREHAPQRPYLVCSQNWGLLERFHAEPAAHVVHSVGGARALGRVAAHIEAQERSMISIHRKLLSRDVVAELHRYAGSIMTWPVNDEATAARLFAWGVDGVITDRIAIVRWVQQQEAAPGSRSLA